MRNAVLASVAAFLLAAGMQGAIVYQEVTSFGSDPDLSNNDNNPTNLALPMGESNILGTVGPTALGGDDARDDMWIVASLPAIGVSLTLIDLDPSINTRFRAFSAVPFDPPNLIASVELNGSGTYDLLALWGITSLPAGGFGIKIDDRDRGLAQYDLKIEVAPEPATYALVGLGLAGLALIRRRRRA